MTDERNAVTLPNTVRCPTCRAVQEWSDTCRRCKSDLRLLREVAVASERHRRLCLEQLRARFSLAAQLSAERVHALRADDESRRLLALTALHCGDWVAAQALAQSVLPDGAPQSNDR